jgi:hypothetical protein
METELETEGGEIEFVSKMMSQSLTLWFRTAATSTTSILSGPLFLSSMLGFKSSVEPLIEVAQKLKVCKSVAHSGRFHLPSI